MRLSIVYSWPGTPAWPSEIATEAHATWGSHDPTTVTPDVNSRRSLWRRPTAVHILLCSRLKTPCPLDPTQARARARGSTAFETFKAQNAEICTPPRPCLQANWNLERPKHKRGGVRFSRLSRLKNPEICTGAGVLLFPKASKP